MLFSKLAMCQKPLFYWLLLQEVDFGSKYDTIELIK